MALKLCNRNLTINVPQCISSMMSLQVRGMKSVNTRSPRPMHIIRAKLMEVTKYQKPKDLRPMAEQCSMRIKEKKEIRPHLVQSFLAKQCRQQLLSRSLIAVFHHDGLSIEKKTLLKRRLRKADIHLKMYGNKVVREAIDGTHLKNIEPLMVGQNVMAVSDEQKVKELIKITKKLPKIFLLGGLVENRLMSAQQMVEFAQLPTKGTLQGQLVGILSQSVGSTYTLLQQHQQQLVTSLSQWVKQRQETSV